MFIHCVHIASQVQGGECGWEGGTGLHPQLATESGKFEVCNALGQGTSQHHSSALALADGQAARSR